MQTLQAHGLREAGSLHIAEAGIFAANPVLSHTSWLSAKNLMLCGEKQTGSIIMRPTSMNPNQGYRLAIHGHALAGKGGNLTRKQAKLESHFCLTEF